jgi:hypothetical protein
MYACIPGTGVGFFKGVCTLSSATANSYDPPPPRNAKEPEPHRQGSGPMWITHRATVDGALAWGRGKPPPAHCQSTAPKPPTTLNVVDTSLKASRAVALLVGSRFWCRHDHAKSSSMSWSRPVV